MGKVIDSHDLAYWDSINAEMAEIAGTEAFLYVLKPEENKDPLYNEPNQFTYAGPYAIMVVVRQPKRTIDVTERGKERINETQIWFSRAHLEDRDCPIPREGDVLEFWDAQYDLEDIVDESQVPTSPYPSPIQFVMNAKRRERFIPERKTGAPVSLDDWDGVP